VEIGFKIKNLVLKFYKWSFCSKEFVFSITIAGNGYAIGETKSFTNSETLGFSKRAKPKALLLVKLLAFAEEQSQKLCSW